MTLRFKRVMAVAVSVIAGVAAAAIAGKLTEGWTWPLAIALAVTIAALITTQLWLTKSDDSDGRKKVIASGPASLASGGSIDATVESDISGSPAPGSPSSTADIAATGIASIAAAKKIRGRIKTRYSDR